MQLGYYSNDKNKVLDCNRDRGSSDSAFNFLFNKGSRDSTDNRTDNKDSTYNSNHSTYYSKDMEMDMVLGSTF